MSFEANIEEVEIENGNELFPIFLKLKNFQTLIVGGGNVGLEKLSALITNSPKAKVTIVADLFLQEVNTLPSASSSVSLKIAI